MVKIKQLLAKPFPQEESIFETFAIAAAISVFVVLFLAVFEPFGIHTLESNQFLICLGFGVVSFLASVVYEFFFVKVLRAKGGVSNFTYGRWIVYLSGAMVCISLANFLFIRLTLFDDIQWNLYPYMLRATFAIGFFPTILIGAIALLNKEQKYQTIAAELDSDGALDSDSEATIDTALFDIPIAQIRYIEAMQNYINIGYLDPDGEFKQQMERATLKRVLDDLVSDSILRCHRSYVLNKAFISSISGNSQGLLVSLNGSDKKIPVSRSYVPLFRKNKRLQR